MLITAFLLYTVSILHNTHMFQLNSYKPKVHIKWLMKNKSEFARLSLFAIVSALIPLFIKKASVCMLLSSVLYITAAIINLPRKAKKPLVYTKRVIRLLITCAAVFAAVWAVTALFIKTRFGVTVTALFLALIPFVLLLCNLINRPLEKAVSNHFVKDAKRIIADHDRLITIGVTGSYGKTSVKFMLGTLLEAKYNVLVTPENYNTTLGVTITVRNFLRATHDVFVCEMGAKNVGDIKEICDIVHPKHAVITSIGPQHLESFKTLDNVKRTKFELADAIADSGKLFVNGEDGNIASCSHPHPSLSYGFTSDCDYYADRISVSSSGTSFYINHGDESVKFETSLIGRHNVLNLTGALAISCELGIEMSKLVRYAKKIRAVQHRLELSKRGNMTVIDDAYNSNPSGAKAALDALALFDGYKVIVTPGMVELGAVEAEENYKFGQNIAKVCDFAVLVGEKQTEPIYKGLIDSGYPTSKIFVAPDLQSGADKAFTTDTNGQERIVLFENDLPDNY